MSLKFIKRASNGHNYTIKFKDSTHNQYCKMMFFTCSRVHRYYFEDCTLKYDIGPFKKGDHIDYIYNLPHTTTFIFYELYRVWTSCYRMSLVKFIRVHSSAKKIQRAWRRCISDPTYKICKKRLLNEFNGITFPKCNRVVDEIEFDFDAEVPEIFDRPLHSIRYHLKHARDQEFEEFEPEPEFPAPFGKRIFIYY